MSKHARRPKQLTIVGVQRVHLSPHEAANGFGQIALQLGEAGAQTPDAVLLPHDASQLQIAERVGHEQRMAFGPLVNHVREPRRKGVRGELHREIPRHLWPVEEARPQLTAQASRDQIELQRQERMSILRKVGGAGRDDDEDRQLFDPPRQVRQQVCR